MNKYYLYIIIGIIILLFIFYCIIPVTRDFRIKKKNKGISFYEYYSEGSTVFQTAGIIFSFLFSIIAILLALDSYVSSNNQFNLAQQTFQTILEQKEIAEKDYLNKINPILKIELTEKDFEILGFRFINDGVNDIEDLNINKATAYYNINKNKFASKSEGTKSWKSIQTIKPDDTVNIYFDSTNIDIQNLKFFINMLPGMVGFDKNDILIGVYIYNISYRRKTDKNIYKTRKILTFHEASINGKKGVLITSSDSKFSNDEDKFLIKKIEALDDSLH